MRVAGMVHTRPDVSISAHSAPRTSPHRAAVSTRNSKASLTTGAAPDSRTAFTAAGTSLVRQRPHVLHGRPLRSEDRPDAVTGVVVPQLHRHGPFQNRADTLAHPPGSLRLLVPDGREDLQNVGAGHFRHQSPPDPREGVGFQTADPGALVSGVAPSGLFLFQHARRSGGKGRRDLGAALLGQWVAALAGDLAVGQRLGARLGEWDQRGAA